MEYILSVEDLSRRQRLSGVQSYWMYGLDLSWPINKRRDLPKLPRPIRVETPQDHIVKAWAEALERESDPRVKLVWYLISQHGLRPQHVCLLKWRNIRYGEDGAPAYILADGAVEKFKTNSRVLGAFAPNTATALRNWAEGNPGRQPTDLIVPSIRGRERFDWQRPMNTCKQFNRLWKGIEEKHRLPNLTAQAMRHWVKSACREAELSLPATCALQGHDSGSGGISNYYDNPSEAVILTEQREKIPFGPLARLGIGPVVKVGDYPREVERLLADYFAGRLKQGALVDALAEMRAAWRPGEPLLYPNMLG